MSTLETYPKPSDKQILDTMSFLIERGANIHTADEDGNTVLHLAINNHNPEMIKLLLSRGAKADAKNNEGKTAYQCAKEFDMKEVMAVFPESTQ